ncbi:neurofilament heavy polypeptide [Ricinus communis]|uniref:SHSP domain-containing protein n=1 Tax=Ricinus communis TaxID=3988 RepID=B9SE69_RICCO|nr:neurofilament heavy polypeptide [Ricinus communis]EEF38028.1 conserved hypothetical protein [Ricinus communis]|eukprot:XP_002524288.1 neurofilament heavy polypeptide [Ricinus communis]
MELELGLKITRNRDDITSHANLRITKDFTGPLFLSRETDTMFLLIAYLKGFKRENIEIDINKDGDRITINGKRAVQEMVLSGWIICKKDVELRAFRKVFQIPDGVVLDRVKAKFNDKESSLTIVMPKLVKGMQGVEIQEVKEFDIGEPHATQSGHDCKLPEGEHKELKKKRNEEAEEVGQKEIGRKEPETPRIITDENAKEIAEVFPDNSKEMMLREKPEESKIKRVVEKNVDEGEFQKMKDVAEAELAPERFVDMKLQEKPEIEGGKESEGATPEKAESPDMAATSQVIAATEPEKVKKEKKIERPEEKKLNPSKKLPQLKEQQKQQDKPEAEIVEEEKIEEHGHEREGTKFTEAEKQEIGNPPTQFEQGQATEAVKESREQESEGKVQETKNSDADKKQNQAEIEHSKQQPKRNEDNGQAENPDGTGNEIEQEANDKAKLPEGKQMEEHELLEIEKQKEHVEQAAKAKNAASKGSKLSSPLVVAGSAILVSLIVLVINFIRDKRR